MRWIKAQWQCYISLALAYIYRLWYSPDLTKELQLYKWCHFSNEVKEHIYYRDMKPFQKHFTFTQNIFTFNHQRSLSMYKILRLSGENWQYWASLYRAGLVTSNPLIQDLIKQTCASTHLSPTTNFCFHNELDSIIYIV